METSAGRLARVGAIGFVALWALGTLVVVAVTMTGPDRPSLADPVAGTDDTSATGEEPDATPADTDAAEPAAGDDPAPPSATDRVAAPDHLAPVEAVPTEVLPGVADAAQPQDTQPTLTG